MHRSAALILTATKTISKSKQIKCCQSQMYFSKLELSNYTQYININRSTLVLFVGITIVKVTPKHYLKKRNSLFYKKKQNKSFSRNVRTVIGQWNTNYKHKEKIGWEFGFGIGFKAIAKQKTKKASVADTIYCEIVHEGFYKHFICWQTNYVSDEDTTSTYIYVTSANLVYFLAPIMPI